MYVRAALCMAEHAQQKERVMNGFKRLMLFVFSLAGLVCLAILGMPWFGYGGKQLGKLIYVDGFWVLLEVTLVMTVCFLVFNLGRALFSRKRTDTIKVMNIEGGEVSVTKTAVSSQAGHIVKALGVGTAKSVEVSVNKKSGMVDIATTVLPYESIDVTAEAPILHDALVTGLGAMCGEKLGNVSVGFLEPEHGSSLVEFDESGEDAQASAEGAAPVAEAAGVAAADAATAVSAAGVPAPAPADSGDITIPMRSEKSE